MKINKKKGIFLRRIFMIFNDFRGLKVLFPVFKQINYKSIDDES